MGFVKYDDLIPYLGREVIREILDDQDREWDKSNKPGNKK